MSEVIGVTADPLKVGVIGVGVMGSNHARVLADIPGVHLVGIADPDRKQRDVVGANLRLRRIAATSTDCCGPASMR